MKKPLNNISTIQTGLFAIPVPDGEIVYLQAKHFDESGQQNGELYPELASTKSTKKHILQPDDILFAGKGTRNFAARYEGINPAVASTSFFVIRINKEYKSLVLPDFMTWHLNHPNTMRLLKAAAIGSSIASISKIVLERIVLSIPDLEMQSKILKIAKLRKKEKALKVQIENLQESFIQQKLINTLNNSKK